MLGANFPDISGESGPLRVDLGIRLVRIAFGSRFSSRTIRTRQADGRDHHLQGGIGARGYLPQRPPSQFGEHNRAVSYITDSVFVSEEDPSEMADGSLSFLAPSVWLSVGIRKEVDHCGVCLIVLVDVANTGLFELGKTEGVC